VGHGSDLAVHFVWPPAGISLELYQENGFLQGFGGIFMDPMKIYTYLQTIPKGKVVTYGQIAQHLGNKGLARVVGNVLHVNPEPDVYPCYKVVSAQGRLAPNFGFGGLEGQKSRLEQEGIEVVNDAVNLEKYQWKTP
jgi:O-6-methylguanine DNA methyltransferase